MSEFMKTYPILNIRTHAPDLKTFYMPLLPERIAPGQFLMVWLPGVDEKPFSVSNVLSDRIEITVRKLGPYTSKLFECEPGQYLGMRGPFGNGFKPVANTLIVGGGCGVAPVRYVAKYMEQRNMPFEMVVGIRTISDLMFREEYIRSGTDIATDDGSYGHKGFVTDLVRPLLASRKFDCLSASGPEPLLLALRQLALEARVPVQLSFERYMKCGIGICGQCCMDGTGIRLCVEGPVLNEQQLAGITELGLPHRDATGQRKESPKTCTA